MKKIISIIVISLLLIGALAFHSSAVSKQRTGTNFQPTVSLPHTQQDTFSYQGQSGKDALTLLQAHTSIGQDASGLVNAIGGRKADASQHEYWAFYVNGKMASVGPAQYVTKKGDTIEWRIEKY